MKPARRLQTLQQPQSLLVCLRQFLTPAVWKQPERLCPTTAPDHDGTCNPWC
jgi:hypothetical protein